MNFNIVLGNPQIFCLFYNISNILPVRTDCDTEIYWNL
jgi:hypothetical protein